MTAQANAPGITVRHGKPQGITVRERQQTGSALKSAQIAECAWVLRREDHRGLAARIVSSVSSGVRPV
jgi:hypothetical protein